MHFADIMDMNIECGHVDGSLPTMQDDHIFAHSRYFSDQSLFVDTFNSYRKKSITVRNHLFKFLIINAYFQFSY